MRNILNIPIVTRNLLIINVLVFFASYVFGVIGIDFDNLFGLFYIGSSNFGVWQFFTSMFMHGNIMHIATNMFMLWMFGSVIEHVWGPRKFLFYYIICGIGGGLLQELAWYCMPFVMDTITVTRNGVSIDIPSVIYIQQTMAIGASGAVVGLLLAFGMLFPNERMFIIPIPVPIKAKWLVTGMIAIEIFSSFSPGSDIAHVVHVGGALTGFLLIMYWKRHPYSGYGNMGMHKGHQFFDRMKDSWEKHTGKVGTGGSNSSWGDSSQHNSTTQNSDWDYNAQKNREQEEIDRILDKIRKSGYDSLSKAEKQKLFDSSKK